MTTSAIPMLIKLEQERYAKEVQMDANAIRSECLRKDEKQWVAQCLSYGFIAEKNQNSSITKVIRNSTYLRKLSFSSLSFSASFALYLINRSTSCRFSSWKRTCVNEWKCAVNVRWTRTFTCTFLSFSSKEANASCSAVCSSLRHVFSDLSSCIDVVSITTSALRLAVIVLCSDILWKKRSKWKIVCINWQGTELIKDDKTDVASFSVNTLFCLSNFKLKSTIICEFSPFRLCSSVNSSCCVNNFFSNCEILAAAAAPLPLWDEFAPDRSCSFSTDSFRFRFLSS